MLTEKKQALFTYINTIVFQPVPQSWVYHFFSLMVCILLGNCVHLTDLHRGDAKCLLLNGPYGSEPVSFNDTHTYVLVLFFLSIQLPVVCSLALNVSLIFLLTLENGWCQKTVIVEMLHPTLQQIITHFWWQMAFHLSPHLSSSNGPSNFCHFVRSPVLKKYLNHSNAIRNLLLICLIQNVNNWCSLKGKGLLVVAQQTQWTHLSPLSAQKLPHTWFCFSFSLSSGL